MSLENEEETKECRSENKPPFQQMCPCLSKTGPWRLMYLNGQTPRSGTI